ncbi:MAG TPA: ATP-binding cassette domain-containing protein, partial [Diaminobutyricibacter sp.]
LGEVTALVGDNGAGKSTLVKCIGGTYSIDDGDFYFEGRRARVSGPRDAAVLGIEIVYQDLALCDNLDIVQNMFLGREETELGTFDEGKMEREASETLRSLSVRTVKSVRQKVSSLSGGQRQTVAIARSVLKSAKVVILDEPTAALGVAQTEQVLSLVKRLAERGVGVLMISHNLVDVFQVADFISVLYLGQMVAELETSQTNSDDVVGYITGSKTYTGATA